MSDKNKDPVFHCDVYKNIGCAHVGGVLCDLGVCPLNKKYLKSCLPVDVNNIKKGTWIKDENGFPWIKIEDDDEAHVDGMVCNLFNGDVRHVSKLSKPVVYFSHNDIVW